MDNKIRIALVDDHAVLRSGLKMLLNSQEDMEVVGEFASGEEALQNLAGLDMTVVLMDISMPGMGGIETLSALNQQNLRLPVIVLTMHHEEQYLQQALQQGARGYVLKQAADTELLQAIRMVAGGDMYIHPSLSKALVQAVFQKNGNRSDGDSGAKGKESSLTNREIEVLQLVALGHTNREVAEKLSISIKTVETHKARIMEKLECHKRSELVRLARELGYI